MQIFRSHKQQNRVQKMANCIIFHMSLTWSKLEQAMLFTSHLYIFLFPATIFLDACQLLFFFRFHVFFTYKCFTTHQNPLQLQKKPFKLPKAPLKIFVTKKAQKCMSKCERGLEWFELQGRVIHHCNQ